MSISLSPARAAASRRNGAKSQGPKTAEGKARSARNGLKHGLCARTHLLVADEDAQAFAALEAALTEELAPDGAMQTLLVGRIVRAAWRLERAERIEAELLEFRMDSEKNLALALIRDGNGTRSFDTLLRYRGSALAELFRVLRTLQALRHEARTSAVPQRDGVPSPLPSEPKARTNPGSAPPRPAEEGDAAENRPTACSCGAWSAHHALPNDPEGRTNAGPPPDQPGRRVA